MCGSGGVFESCTIYLHDARANRGCPAFRGPRDFGGFVYVLDRFPQRDLGLWAFMCPINSSLFSGYHAEGNHAPPSLSGYHAAGYHAPPLYPATSARATTPHRSLSRLPRPYTCNQANRLPRLQGYHTRATSYHAPIKLLGTGRLPHLRVVFSFFSFHR